MALEYLAILEEEKRLEQVQRVGAYFTGRLKELVEKFDIAVEARGVGMIQAMELSIPAKGFVEGAIENGVLINVTQDKCCASCRRSCWKRSTWTRESSH